jgi:hypothetical protein
VQLLRGSVVLSLGVAILVPSHSAAASPPGEQPADAQSVPTVASARAVAATYGHPVEVAGMQSASSTSYANPDGTLTTEMTAAPTRVLEAGRWIPIDTTLVRAPDGSISPRATAAQVQVGAGGERTVAALTVPGGSVSYTWPAALPDPDLAGDEATFPNVLPGMDLKVRVSDTGLETFLVFKQRPSATLQSVDLGFTTSGLSIVRDAHGRISYRDASGAEAASTSAPRAWDARGIDRSVAAPMALLAGSGQAVANGTGAGRFTARLRVPQSLLDDPGVTFPLTVDPDATCSGCTESLHGYVDSGCASCDEINSSFDSGYVHVGTYDGSSKTHGVFGFSQGNTHGTTIVTAHLDTTEVYSWSCSARTVTVYQSGAFTSSTLWPGPGTIGSGVSQNVAYGHDSNCPAHSVGFDVTGAVTDMANNSGQTSYYFQLRASDTDVYGWKKFSPTASLVVTYDRPPGTPAGRSIRPCGPVCGSMTYTNDATPTLTAATTDPDGDHLRYDFEVWASHSASPTVRASAGSVSNVPSGSQAAWAVSTVLPDGDYEYRVRAYDGRLFGPWSSGWAQFVVDTHAPAAPTVTASGPLSTDPNSFDGTVGSSVESVTVSSVAADTAYGYIYGVFRSTATVVFPTNPQCGTSVNGFTVACGSQLGAPITMSVAAVDSTSTFIAVTFDAAGNALSAPSQQNFYAQRDIAAAQAGHAWLPDVSAVPSSGCGQATVPDSADPAHATPQPLTLTGGVCWAADTPLPPPPVGGLHFDGTNSTAITGPLLDDTKSYTVAAWVYSTGTDTSRYYTAVSARGATDSAFYLQRASSQTWRMCVRSQSTPVIMGCASSLTNAVPVLPAWIFLVGVYDAVNHQIRLIVSSDGSASTPFVAAYTQPGSAEQLPIVVGGARSASNDTTNNWQGDVVGPMVMPGIASSTQIALMGQALIPPSAQ